MLVLCPVVVGYAQDTKAYEEKKARLEREIAIIDKQLAENASQSSSMLSDLTLIRKNISNRKLLLFISAIYQSLRNQGNFVYETD